MGLYNTGVSLLAKIVAEAVFPRLDVPAQEYAIDIENKKLKLYKAATSGNWGKAEAIFRNNSEQITPSTMINQLGETALHIATAAHHTKFVKQLVGTMSAEDLAAKTVRGDTAFFYAAVSGYTEVAKIMLRKNPALATIPGGEDLLPIQAAALHGNELMVRRLYKHAKNKLADLAIQMVSEKPSLATQPNNKGETVLSAFARKPGITSEKFSNIFLNDYIFPCRRYTLRIQGFELLKLVLQQVLSVVEEGNSMLIKKALFIAAKQGNWEFLTTVVHSDPGLAIEVDENRYTIFHIGVLHRHVKVFNIIHEIDSIENVIKLMKDNEGNNILHLVGKLPLSGLEDVRGPALQLQHGLLWFEEVEKMVGAHEMGVKNREEKSPRELFVAEHTKLRDEGEKWMKDTVNSCMVVSTLVAGVAFASSVTLPGGNGGDTGIPNFLHHISFKIFALANALSLICSASSILFFLTIFTSRYSMADFKGPCLSDFLLDSSYFPAQCKQCLLLSLLLFSLCSNNNCLHLLIPLLLLHLSPSFSSLSYIFLSFFKLFIIPSPASSFLGPIKIRLSDLF
ncbi:ankyrin repeat-containing protein NPR4-like isoform X2 [Euphorbia lathyris]|uniref:ankyrin repeat-containing protein NPR4-like isoform X2 n=1 Tax=Euphorbia lathyris TaxID=212925 RepID=UPI0033140B50